MDGVEQKAARQRRRGADAAIREGEDAPARGIAGAAAPPPLTIAKSGSSFPPMPGHASRLGGRVMLLGLALVVAVLAAAAWEIGNRRDAAYADAQRETDSLSLAMSEHTTRTFEAVDLILKYAAETLRADGIATPEAFARRMATQAVHDRLREEIVGHSQLDAVILVGADGRLVNFSRAWPVPQIDLSDRDYFRTFRATPSLLRLIGEPISSRAVGERTFVVARRLVAPDGTFIGLVIAAIRVEYLEALYRDVAGGEGSNITLRRSDGTLLVRYPQAEQQDGSQNVIDPAMLQEIAWGAEISRTQTASRRDGIRRLRTARSIKDFPLILTVGREVAVIDAQWRRGAAVIGSGAGLVALVIGCGALLLARQVSRRETSEATLTATLEHMSQGIMMIDGGRRIPVCNTKAMAMLNLPAMLMAAQPSFDEIIRHQWASGEFGLGGTALDEDISRLFLRGAVPAAHQTYERRRPDGTTIEVRSVALPDGGVVRTFTDVTVAREREAVLEEALHERDVAEAALRQHRDDLEREVVARTRALAATETRLVEAIETIPEGFVLCDAEDRIVLCNAAYRQLYGMTEDTAAPGTPFEDVVRSVGEKGIYPLQGKDLDAWLTKQLADHRATSSIGRRFEHHLVDGRWIEVHERRTGDGGIVGLRIDVTEARRREAVEGERQKLAALGQLAGGVAHEINNLLQPALILPEMVRDRLPADDLESRADLDAVIEDVRRARDIVRSILQFARKEEPALLPLDIATEIAAALAFVRGLLPPGIAVCEEHAGKLGMVVANKTQLTQVMTNLVVNAAHAMDGRGTITVTLDEGTPSARAAETFSLTAGQRYVTIAVADEGSGMDAATQARIFEPFFTTKPVGQGTGLGLSVVYGILHSWNGAIIVDSAPGCGTTFTLFVPAVDGTDDAGSGARGKNAA
jgi:signal transduction histidine kinase